MTYVYFSSTIKHQIKKNYKPKNKKQVQNYLWSWGGAGVVLQYMEYLYVNNLRTRCITGVQVLSVWGLVYTSKYDVML